MKSVYNFVVTPKGERYNNKKKVGDSELILNTEIFNHQYINRSQLEIGMNEIKKHEMMHNIAGLRDGLTLLQSEFEKEYGTFDVNIQDGTINYPKENGEVNKED